MNSHYNNFVLTFENVLKLYAGYYKADVRDAELGIHSLRPDVRCPVFGSSETVILSCLRTSLTLEHSLLFAHLCKPPS